MIVAWKLIEGYSNYSVSNTGLIKNNKTNKILKLFKTPNGYYRVTIKPFGKAGISKSLNVHREVASSFIDNPDNKPHVNHKDGNKINNIASNLEWVTTSENALHAYRTGLSKIVNGEDVKHSILTEDVVKMIRNSATPDVNKLAAQYGVHRTTIYDIVNFRTWKHIKESQ